MLAGESVPFSFISLVCAWISTLEKFGLVFLVGFVYNDDRYYGVDDSIMHA